MQVPKARSFVPTTSRKKKKNKSIWKVNPPNSTHISWDLLEYKIQKAYFAYYNLYSNRTQSSFQIPRSQTKKRKKTFNDLTNKTYKYSKFHRIREICLKSSSQFQQSIPYFHILKINNVTKKYSCFKYRSYLRAKHIDSNSLTFVQTK